MSEQISNVNAQLRTWEDQNTLDIVEIDRLKADRAVIELEIAALRAFEGDRGKIHADCKQLKKCSMHTLNMLAQARSLPPIFLHFTPLNVGLNMSTYAAAKCSLLNNLQTAVCLNTTVMILQKGAKI